MTIEARFHIQRGGFTLNTDLILPDRGVTGLFGPSGCGKTTFLRAIAGLDFHPGSFLKVGNKVWQDPNRFIPPHRRPLGYVFQEPSLFPHLTVRGNVEYGLKRVPPADRKISLDTSIEWMGIGHLLPRRPETLSGGEQQRVAIARALAVSPGLLLMDEPLTGLDAEGKQQLLPYLERLHGDLDVPVLYVSHAREEMARLTDHLVVLEAGSVLEAGPLREIFTRLGGPLARDPDASAVIEAVVSGHDETFHLTRLGFDGGEFFIARKDLPVGSAVRLRLAARDVSLSHDRPSKTSILNTFPASIDQITTEAEAQVTVRLIAGSTPILSRITRKSAEDLGLKPGKSVYVQVKSVAVLT